MTSQEWHRLGRVDPATLANARNDLHHLAQVAAAAGHTLLEAKPDDSQPNLGWVPALGALVGHPLPGPGRLRAGLRLADRTLLVIGDDCTPTAEIGAAGRTLDELQGALGAALSDQGLAIPSGGLVRPPYELPPSPIATGGPLSDARRDSDEELAAWFHDAHRALDRFVAERGDASEVRCWPHHFDIATLIAIETDASGAATQTVGLGLSPGDGTVAAPYFYVSPWPYPEAKALPPLTGTGRWHQEGFVAALLPSTSFVSQLDASAHEGAVESFLADAFAASVRALEH